MADTPGGEPGLGFVFGLGGGLVAGGVALVVAFVVALVAPWPRASGSSGEPLR